MRTYQLKIDLPFLKKGRAFVFEDDTANVYAVLDGKVATYPLREGLAGYLWMLLTEKNKYLEPVLKMEGEHGQL